MTDPVFATRRDHLEDLAARLDGQVLAAAGTPVPVMRSRVHPLSARRLPVIAVFAPDEDLDRIGTGHPQFTPSVTLSVDVKCAWLFKDDAPNEGWDVEAMDLTEQVKRVLFSDPAWMRRWRAISRVAVKQYLDDRVREAVHCGEILTITVEPVRPQAYPPAAPTLGTVQIETRPRVATAPAVTAVVPQPEDP